MSSPRTAILVRTTTPDPSRRPPPPRVPVVADATGAAPRRAPCCASSPCSCWWLSCWPCWSRRSSSRPSSSPRARWSRPCTAAPGATGDRVLVNKIPYWFGDPEPGDIVVFKGPDTWTPEVTVDEPSNWFTGALLWLGRTVGVAPPSEDDFVKRVIATAGQTVQCCDTEGRVTVDGNPLDEPYIFENTPIEQRAFGPVTVPEGRLWVMGDHRSAVGGLQAAHDRSLFGDDWRRRRDRQGRPHRLADQPVRNARFTGHPRHRGGRSGLRDGGSAGTAGGRIRRCVPPRHVAPRTTPRARGMTSIPNC